MGLLINVTVNTKCLSGSYQNFRNGGFWCDLKDGGPGWMDGWIHGCIDR